MSKTIPTIFGIALPTESREEVLKKIETYLQNQDCAQVVTLNPEILLHAKGFCWYAEILKRATIKTIDGFGIRLVGFLQGWKISPRITGVALSEYIVEKAKESSLRVGLVIRKDGLSTKNRLLSYCERQGITPVVIEAVDCSDRIIPEPLQDVQVLLVGLGAPYQEEFIASVKDSMPDLKLAAGVGGTFDFWTGTQRRAPKLVQKVGVEWLWRLLRQPNRIKRIWNAVVIFPFFSMFRNK